MKKSALLAVSALSLGVVGLATFTPVVNAIDSAPATVSVTIEGSLGVGVNDDDGSTQTLDVTFDSMTANDLKTKQATISTTNNTGKAATLSVKDSDATTALTSGDNTIQTGTNVKAGNSAWGISVNNDSTYAAIPANTEAGVTIGSDNAATSKDFQVTYGVSTSATQATGTYTDQIVYSFTQS